MSGHVSVAGQSYPIVDKELHIPLRDGSRWIFLWVTIAPEGGFGFWNIELPLLGELSTLPGQRIHVRRDGSTFEDDSLGTDCVGMDTMTDLNCWKVGDQYYDWIEMLIDFRSEAVGACSITVRARLVPSDAPVASDSPVAGVGIAGVSDAHAEFSVKPDEDDPCV
ncbi:MAG: hypothetical protein LC135_02900 [Phycisphaerae bacterium]|jgi:hypothetical protein|nr:hypothetical protein [Phycisphaerae bacterium]MCZ2398803.1 hypothetical protein [Phycisphaerae bacterium]